MADFARNLVFLCVLLVSSSISCQKLVQPCLNREKLCFGLPANCINSQGQDECGMLVRLVPTESLDGIEVELFAQESLLDASSRWFALGISDDKKMGDDLVAYCVHHSNGSVEIGEAYNIEQEPERIYDTAVSGKYGSREDGWVRCSWRHKGRVRVKGKTFDVIRQAYHLLLAYGGVDQETGWLAYHRERIASNEPTKLYSVNSVVSAATSTAGLVKFHSALMMIAWLGFVSVSIMVARHYKESWKNQTVWGVKIWFALHRGLMLCALLFVALGMTSIFLHAGWRANSLHQYLGVIANVLMFIQPIGAFFRPSLDHPKRDYFNWIHWTLGNLAHILAISAVFFVVKLPSIKLTSAFLWVMVVYVVTHVLVHIIMQFHSLLSQRNKIDDMALRDYHNHNTGFNQVGDEKNSDSFKQTMLGLYVVLVATFTFTLILIVLIGGRAA